MGKYADKISQKAVENTVRTISHNFSRTKIALKEKGISLARHRNTRDEVRKIFKAAEELGEAKDKSIIQTGWRAGLMAKRAFKAEEKIQAASDEEANSMEIKNRRGAARRLGDLRLRVFRPKSDEKASNKVGETKTLRGSRDRVDKKSMADAKTTASAKAAPPTLHAVPNVGPRTDPTLPQISLADVTDPKQNQLDELVNPESVVASNTPAISKEEFEKLQEQAKEISGRP